MTLSVASSISVIDMDTATVLVGRQPGPPSTSESVEVQLADYVNKRNKTCSEIG
jgi:hypothetical protein